MERHNTIADDGSLEVVLALVDKDVTMIFNLAVLGNSHVMFIR